MEQIGLWAGFVLTLMVFSYILGDNFLYRLAVYIFVGLAAGFTAIVTWDSVLMPWFNSTLLAPGGDIATLIFGALPLALGALLLLKANPRLGKLGHLALALIIGVGTAVALVGAISGTLIPLTRATTSTVTVNPVSGILLVVGVICTLVYFQYVGRRLPDNTVRRAAPVRALSLVGQGVIVITLGALYAAAILTSLTVFSERVSFILARIGGN